MEQVQQFQQKHLSNSIIGSKNNTPGKIYEENAASFLRIRDDLQSFVELQKVQRENRGSKISFLNQNSYKSPCRYSEHHKEMSQQSEHDVYVEEVDDDQMELPEFVKEGQTFVDFDLPAALDDEKSPLRVSKASILRT